MAELTDSMSLGRNQASMVSDKAKALAGARQSPRRDEHKAQARLDPAEVVEMDAFTFDGMLGWLHTPVGPNHDVGVVLVSPLGRDSRCAYLPMRLFADQLAADGYPAVRYDHRGTGDSLELPDETADALPGWLAGVEQAIGELRARTGVRHVVLGGVRFGATLAALKVSQAAGLILLAPVLNGKAWLKRLRFSGYALANHGEPLGDDRAFDAEGLCLSPATVSSINAIDLSAAAPLGAPVFIAAQNQMVRTYAEGRAAVGASVLTSDFPGFNELFVEPADNLPPWLVFERARLWLRDTFGKQTAPASSNAGIPQDAAKLRPPGAVERVVILGERLRGVLCEPELSKSASTAVVFCNTGGDPRAGVGGFASQAARRLANEGVASLRFDFVGLGDSAPLKDGARCHAFETPREADMDAATAFLVDRGHEGVVTVGICSGAYHALRAAWRNPKVTGVFAISPVKLVWRPGDELAFGVGRPARPLSFYMKALFDFRAWKLASQRHINVADFATAVAARLRGLVSASLARHAASSPLSQMERFAKRGGQACFLMGRNDSSLEEIEAHFGSSGSAITRLPNMLVTIIPDLDHGLTRLPSRILAAEALANWLSGLAQASAQPVCDQDRLD